MKKNKKNILIIGGCGLIGKQITQSLLSENNFVFNVDLINNNEFKKYKNYFFLKSDISKFINHESIIKNAIKNLDTFNNLIYCAYPKSRDWGKKLDQIEHKDVIKNFEKQLIAPLFFTNKIIKYFSKNNGGNIIHFSSIQGTNQPKFHHYEKLNMTSPIEYSIIKSGIISMVKYLSKYHRNKNIKINSISPGGIKNNQNKLFQNRYRRDCNDKGLLEPNDLVGIVNFLISDSSKYINGQNLIIDDGWSL
tara:strand:+ start:979 stop:1725 length:747 start_codon:yes stop_codon:yes gene_type:complete